MGYGNADPLIETPFHFQSKPGGPHGPGPPRIPTPRAEGPPRGHGGRGPERALATTSGRSVVR